MVASKSNLKKEEYCEDYCYARGCDDIAIIICAAFGPCGVWKGDGCPQNRKPINKRLDKY